MEFYLKRHPTTLDPKSVSVVVEELLTAKQSDGLSERSLESLRHYLGKFTGAFSCNIAEVSGRDLDRWIRSIGLSPRTRNNIRASLHTLFRFAVSRRYLPKDHDELDAVALVKDRGSDIEVFSPAEMIEILESARSCFIPFLTLGAFAGIRHAEIQRLDWTDIRFDDGIIEIHARKAKTASRRTVPLLPNLLSWLQPLRELRGPVCPLRSVAFEIGQLVKRMNVLRHDKHIEGEFVWKHNALRHSFISYRLAQIQNTAQVALEAGNSPQILFRHYRELVRPADASAWFAILPMAALAAQGSEHPRYPAGESGPGVSSL